MGTFFQKKLLTKAWVFVLLILTTSCQEQQSNNLENSVVSPAENTNFNLETSESCLADPSVDACIFWKNPVAQSQDTISNTDITSTLKSLQTHGIHINNTLVQGTNLHINRFKSPSHQETQYSQDGFDRNSIIPIKELKIPGQDSLVIGLQPQEVSFLDRIAKSSFQSNFANNRVAPSYRSSLKSGLQQNGVFLRNNSYNITINYQGIERVTRREDGSWKFQYGQDHHPIVQIMTYYYLMYQMVWMQENAGGWYAHNKNITAVALDERVKNNAYWSPMENKISLGIMCRSQRSLSLFNSDSCTPKMEMGLSAEITLHEAGHANFYHSINQEFTENLCRLHTDCSGNSICNSNKDPEELSVCCRDERGCFFAINEGQADFHAAMIFPELPQIGETITNSVDGMKCQSDTGIHRNPQINTNITAADIFNQCNRRFNGEIHDMGILYSSIWWSLYTDPSVNKKEIATLFTNHLPLITYSDNFETSAEKILKLDHLLYQGKYSRIITSEFARRGLTPRSDVVNL